MSEVTYEQYGAVALIQVNRPEVRNAMDMAVFQGLTAAGARAGADDGVRAVVVTGHPNFSSGIDTSIFTNGGEAGGVDIAALQRSFSIFEQIDKPVIAAVSGPAFGAGCQLAAACDFRVAAEDARFALAEVRWGIIPDLGGTQRLPRLIGLSRTRDMAYSGREVLAAEALSWGLADRVVPADDLAAESMAWAESLAAGPPLAIGAMKRLTASAFDTDIQTGLERERSAQRRILASGDFVEAVTARMERRAPTFLRR